MKAVVDRIVQYANRYQLTNVETGEVLGTFDFDEVTGTVQQVGTEIDAELFDSIANDLAKRVRVDAKQNFSAGQKQQARANIDAAGTSGTYENFTSGGVQCAQLYNNADLNDCVPENDKVFQAWVCSGGGTSNTMSNTPFANFGRTFYLTAVKTWRDAQDNNKFRVVQTLYSVQAHGNSLIWTRAIDGSGTLGWSDWKEIVVADGTYPTLGAGYLARRAFVGELGGDQWVKWATVSYPSGIRGSVLFLVNGGQYPDSEGSGLLELNLVRQVQDVSLVVCSGYIKSENFAYVINGTSIDLYVYCPSYRDYQIAVLDELIGTATNKNTCVTFSNVGTGSSTAPEGAVYAVVRNRASYAESIPVASESVFGGAKMWVDGGKLYIKTE